jgi:hypothetical protein
MLHIYTTATATAVDYFYLVYEGVLDPGGADEDEVAVEADDLYSLYLHCATNGLSLERKR